MIKQSLGVFVLCPWSDQRVSVKPSSHVLTDECKDTRMNEPNSLCEYNGLQLMKSVSRSEQHIFFNTVKDFNTVVLTQSLRG